MEDMLTALIRHFSLKVQKHICITSTHLCFQMPTVSNVYYMFCPPEYTKHHTLYALQSYKPHLHTYIRCTDLTVLIQKINNKLNKWIKWFHLYTHALKAGQTDGWTGGQKERDVWVGGFTEGQTDKQVEILTVGQRQMDRWMTGRTDRLNGSGGTDRRVDRGEDKWMHRYRDRQTDGKTESGTTGKQTDKTLQAFNFKPTHCKDRPLLFLWT